MTPLRARLQARGILDADGRLTPQGNAEVDPLIERLRGRREVLVKGSKQAMARR